MKAMIITAFGGPEVFQAADWPKPAPQATELLVRIHAAALNPVDYKIREAGAWARVSKASNARTAFSRAVATSSTCAAPVAAAA